jgi:ABC-type uncharacterized transport system ATPase subunit
MARAAVGRSLARMETASRVARCALHIRALHKRYRAGVPGCAATVAVLRGVDLRVATGEVAVVVAPPGAGLTTLLLCSAGLLRPDAGDVAWGASTSDALPSGDLAPGVSLVLGAPFPTIREAVTLAYHPPGGRRSPAAGSRLLLVGPQARWRVGGEAPAELADALRELADRGAAVLVARRRVDAVCECADLVLTLRDGRCAPVVPTAERVDPPYRPP